MAIEIDFVANERDVVRGADAIEKKFGEVADSLDDVAKSGDDSTERLQRSFRELSDTVKRETREAGDATSRNIRRGAEDANDSLREVRAESLQNAAETFSSFDGDLRSFADGIQGTLGGLVAGLSTNLPAAAAVAAGALGIGLIINAVERAGTETQEFRQDVAAMVQDLITAGEKGDVSLGFVVDRLRELTAETDPAADGLTRLREIADRSEFSFEDLAQAYAGNAEGLDELIEKSRAAQQALEDEASSLDVTTDAGNRRYGELQNQLAAGDQYLTYLDQAKAANEAAAEAERNWLAAGGQELERKAALVEAVNDAYDDVASSIDDFIDKETKTLDVDAYLQAMESRKTALEDYQTALATSSLSPEAKEYIVSLGYEAGSAAIAAYQRATDEQKGRLEQFWAEAGRTNSGEYSAALEQDLKDSTVAGPKVEIDTAEAARATRTTLEEHFRRNPLKITVQAVTPYGADT